MSSNVLRIIPLGGLGEVGRNLMVYEYNGEILIVDAGLMFPENDMLGIDYIIPDLTYPQPASQTGTRHRHHPRARRPHRRHPSRA